MTGEADIDAGQRVHAELDEQAALRRVATLVAEGTTSSELFAAVVAEAARALDAATVVLARYEPNAVVRILASLNGATFTTGSSWKLDGPSVAASVLDTGRPSRIDDYSELPGSIAAGARESQLGSTVGVPIVVDGIVWGVMTVGAQEKEPLPVEMEGRLGHFTELLAFAISNAETREQLRRLAHEQASLRRVATLVAQQASTAEVLAAVAEEVRDTLDVPLIAMSRYEPDGSSTVVGASGDHPFQAGTRWPFDAPTVSTLVRQTGAPAKVDYVDLPGTTAAAARAGGLRTGVGVPIVVDGAVWGVMATASTADRPLPTDVEVRLAQFTGLVATAIANAHARDDLHRLAEQQAALRRVATLVAAGSTTADLWTAVVEEVARVMGAPAVWLLRYGPGRSMTVLAVLNDPAFVVGTQWPLDGTSVTAAVFDTALPVRIDDYSNLEGTLAERTRESGFLSSLGVPIIVDGTVWGAICVGTKEADPLPADTERRLADFTDLVATAISNAEARAELIASRARIVAAGDEARKRIERNLHDGTQQRLLAIGLDVQRIKASVSAEEDDVRIGLERVSRDLESVIEDVRELSRGLHPQMLSRRGLRAALVALARRSPIPVDLDIELDERPPEQIETTVYYAVSEALTNAIKHSNASAISVRIATDHPGSRFATGLDDTGGGLNLHVTVADDGDGGAAPARGPGLAGLVDRIDALGGRLSLESPPGRGTRIVIALPLTSRAQP